MHYCIRYTHVKYQLNRDKWFVKTANTQKNKLNCINLQLAIRIKKKTLFFDMHHREKGTCISIFNKIGLVDQSKPCTNLFVKKIKLHKMQLAIRISKNFHGRTDRGRVR